MDRNPANMRIEKCAMNGERCQYCILLGAMLAIAVGAGGCKSNAPPVEPAVSPPTPAATLPAARIAATTQASDPPISPPTNPPPFVPAPPPPDLRVRIDRALESAGEFVMATQHQDGAWRSRVYDVLNDGPALTGRMSLALHDLPSPKSHDAAHRGAQYLRTRATTQGAIDEGPAGLASPVQTAALAVQALCADGAPGDEGHAWLMFLRSHQLVQAIGWDVDDPEFGGWGIAPFAPRKPRSGPRANARFGSNVGSTLRAIEAMRAAGVPANDPAFTQALSFVLRCQNYSVDGQSTFDDGGFFNANTDLPENLAGRIGADGAGRMRNHSYGLATADGLRAILACGLPLDHPRVRAAQQWLERNFRPDTQGGAFSGDLDPEMRAAGYFAYAASAAKALALFGNRRIATSNGSSDWPEALAGELIKRQRPDGYWMNAHGASKEDDPQVATPLAIEALLTCRKMLDRNAVGG